MTYQMIDAIRSVKKSDRAVFKSEARAWKANNSPMSAVSRSAGRTKIGAAGRQHAGARQSLSGFSRGLKSGPAGTSLRIPTGLRSIGPVAGGAAAWPSAQGNSSLVDRARSALVATGAQAEPAKPPMGAPRRDASLYEAAESLRQATIAPESAAIGWAASMLQRAAHAEADRRPRHAAVALSTWDAIQCTDRPFGSQARRKVLWDASRLLLSPFISTDDEMALLDRMDDADLERVPPFEDTYAGHVLEDLRGDSVR